MRLVSAVGITAPIAVAAWPAFYLAVAAAAGALGYEFQAPLTETSPTAEYRVPLCLAPSEFAGPSVGPHPSITLGRLGLTVTLSRDSRCRPYLQLCSSEQTEEALYNLGHELSQRIVQQYVYQRFRDEIRQRGLVLIEDQTELDHSIRLRVRLCST